MMVHAERYTVNFRNLTGPEHRRVAALMQRGNGQFASDFGAGIYSIEVTHIKRLESPPNKFGIWGEVYWGSGSRKSTQQFRGECDIETGTGWIALNTAAHTF